MYQAERVEETVNECCVWCIIYWNFWTGKLQMWKLWIIITLFWEGRVGNAKINVLRKFPLLQYQTLWCAGESKPNQNCYIYFVLWFCFTVFRERTCVQTVALFRNDGNHQVMKPTIVVVKVFWTITHNTHIIACNVLYAHGIVQATWCLNKTRPKNICTPVYKLMNPYCLYTHNTLSSTAW